MDIGTLMQSFMGVAQSQEQHENDAVYSKPAIYDMMNALNNMETTENDLKSFKKYIEEQRTKDEDESGLKDALSGVQYAYNLDLLVYTENVDGKIVRSDSEELLRDIIVEYMGMDMSAMMDMGENSMMSMFSSSTPTINLWQEMLPGDNGKLVSDLLEKQYDVVYGTWPTEYNEVVLVLDENNELDDMTLYALGLKSKDEIDAIMKASLNKEEIPSELQKWTYEEICDMQFKVILNSSCFILDENTGLYTDLRDTDAGLRYLYDNATSIKVSGIIRPNEKAVATMLTGSIGYTDKLTQYVIAQADDAEAVKAQKDDPTTDIFTGLPFEETTGALSDEEKAEEFKNFVSELDEKGKAEAYIKVMSIPSEEQLSGAVEQTMSNMTRETMEATLVQSLVQQMGMNEGEITDYVTNMSDEELTKIFTEMVTEQVKMQFAAQVKQQMAAMSAEQLSMAFDMSLPTYTVEQCARYYDEVLEFSDSTYDANLIKLGCVDPEKPSTINLYAATFESKDAIEDAIAKYNEEVEELSQIKYTDYVGLMMSSITSIINAITYVLIAFVAISLIVSSIMIGVITLISVQERTKEIGILRAIGASKRDVSGMFNAETVIIGFTSGVLGVLVTYLLCIPINIIIQGLTGIAGLSAVLPIPVAVLLVLISMGLTLFAGIIPSRSAAKKDPVVALRTE